MKNININKTVNPKGLKKDQYDVIIIGAGIGGLVCGCYLAKAGMKVLIVEKHDKAGGYCTAFKRGNFVFNVVNALENCREGGQFGKILKELGIEKKIKIMRSSSPLLIVMPEHKICFKNNILDTMKNIQAQFPHEGKNIATFFDLLMTSSFASLYIEWKNKVFQDILNEYFEDSRLKSLFSFLAGHIGVLPVNLSALATAIHFKEAIFDGGYFPKGGMQAFADSFVERFKEFGGEIGYSCLVKKIKINNNVVEGIILNDGNFLQSKYVVSNCDVKQTFLQLIDKECVPNVFIKKLAVLRTSISVFTVYLGVTRHFKEGLGACHELRYAPTYNVDNPWNESRLKSKRFKGYLFCYFPSHCDSTLAPADYESIAISALVPYINDTFWNKNKFAFADRIIERIEDVVHGLSSYITEKEISTPQTLQRYTLNSDGAMRGWMTIPSQIGNSVMPQESPIRRLLLVGHWVTYPSGEAGLPMAGYSGYRGAKLILKEERAK